MMFGVLAISVIGCVSSIFTLVLNLFMVLKANALFSDGEKKKNDLHLFYYRFVIDIFLALFVAIYLALIIIYCINPSIFNHRTDLMFLTSLPASNIGAMRSIITLSITFERCIAVYAPVFFHNYSKMFPTSLLAILAIVFGLFENFMLFGICEFDFKIQENCVAFGCAINTCFRFYWTSHKTIIFALTATFSAFLCIKLFVLGNELKNNMSKVNRLALLDAGTVTIFDFLPSFIANQWSTTGFFSFENIGPYGAVTKMFGCAIESFLVVRTLLKNHQKLGETSRSFTRKKMFQINN
ncbi:unnamed protein product [Caenorhabditis angaria]|uniref:Serpentine Receptor, class BC (Class B-like) n=1 Tax=Caenorhabditis angaria TaxID=860376 RepID=A0A9P1N519_9PELO|nr:unnamed protein product [Caenorhabditis angaria]